MGRIGAFACLPSAIEFSLEAVEDTPMASESSICY